MNKSYVYTNIQSIMIKKEVYNPNIIKSLLSKRSEKYTSTPLKSYYRNRIDYGDITTSFYKAFEHEFCKYFGIKQLKENELTDYYNNMELLREKGIVTDYEKSIPKEISDKIDITIRGEVWKNYK